MENPIKMDDLIGVLPNHPFVHRVWNHYFHHPFWGVKHPFSKHPYKNQEKSSKQKIRGSYNRLRRFSNTWQCMCVFFCLFKFFAWEIARSLVMRKHQGDVNRGTPKWMVCNGHTLLKWMIWGYHIFSLLHLTFM